MWSTRKWVDVVLLIVLYLLHGQSLRSGMRHWPSSSIAQINQANRHHSLQCRSHNKLWSPSTWQRFPVKQPPNYQDQTKIQEVIDKLHKYSPLVFAGEVRSLQDELTKASLGEGFVLMGGDCAEAFDEFSVNHVRDTFRILLQMALVLTFGGSMPVVKIGRMAGQFAKPRSSAEEHRNGVVLPSYRGDIINGEGFTAEARLHDPERMLQAYHQSAQTLNILRAFSMGGYADISHLHAWNLDFIQHLPAGSRYKALCMKIDESLRFMKAIGVDTTSSTFTHTSFYTAHECLLLPYEQALTRQDSVSGQFYDCSAHMLWIGERTRQVDHAHVHFLSGVENPIGIKISDKITPNELLSLLDALNPHNQPGRVSVIVRMGADKIRSTLPSLIRAVQRAGKTVLWCSDPLHGNTIQTSTGYKTRQFDHIVAELQAFFDVHAQEGSHAGGIHLEMTGKNVTECIGGQVQSVQLHDLDKRYHTTCDPRLNGNQALEVAFCVAERLRSMQGLVPTFPSSSRQ